MSKGLLSEPKLEKNSEVIFQKGCGKVIKMTLFHHKLHRIKIMLLNTKLFCEYLKPFLLRIRTNFYGTPTRNKKVTHFHSKLAFLKRTPLYDLKHHLSF